MVFPTGTAGLAPRPAFAASGSPDCRGAAQAAEQTAALPVNLLISIGDVESGRPDPQTGALAPWPWTVNADGTSHYFSTEQDAVAFVRAAEAAGARDVDVGCFQISLHYHPDAFASLDAAFDPAANAVFAAGFLNQLKLREGSWQAAIADYHSAEPALGQPYQQRVLQAWQMLGTMPAGAAVPALDLDPTVIMQAPAARLVRVITPGEFAPLASGLPRVITP